MGYTPSRTDPFGEWVSTMFACAYVILPVSDVAPSEAIRASLAPFRHGGKGDVPDEWLAFHDETDEVRAAHQAEFAFTREEGRGTQIEGGPHHHLDIGAVNAEMARRGLRRPPPGPTAPEGDPPADVPAPQPPGPIDAR